MNKRVKLKGFTLLELIIVVAVLAVLMMIAVPNIVNSQKNAKLNAANDTARELFMATQDYLTDLQIKGLNAADYFGGVEATVKLDVPTTCSFGYLGGTSQPYQFADNGKFRRYDEAGFGMDTGVMTTSFNSDTAIRCFGINANKPNELSSGVPGLATDKQKNAVTAANEILARMNTAFEGAWIVGVYTDTYTCAFAVYSSNPDLVNDGKYNWTGVYAVASGDLYEQYGDQQHDMNLTNADDKTKYCVGQFPYF